MYTVRHIVPCHRISGTMATKDRTAWIVQIVLRLISGRFDHLIRVSARRISVKLCVEHAAPACQRNHCIAEIQQTSNITYRIYDFNRRDANGNTRELHTELAKGAIDYTVLPDYRTHYQKAQDREVELVSCPYFTTSLYDLTEALTIDYSALDSFVVVICVEGKGTICDDSGNEMPIHQGETVLLPATVKSLRVIPGGNLKMLTSYIK